MFAMGPIEVLLILLTAGGGANDIVSLIPVQAYFKTRDIDIDVAKAVELAGKDPVDGRTQIAQLLALRYLAEESAKLKSAPDHDAHRQLLQRIAAGKTAQDPQGFAKDYAARVLAKLDGTQLAVETQPSLREDAFRWFPADATLLAALDARAPRGAGAAGAQASVAELVKLIPPDALKTAFGFIDKIGNVRVDRIAFALAEHPQLEKGRIYIRITGKANPTWLLEAVKELNQPVRTIRGPRGEPITFFVKQGGPGMMLVGDQDVVIAGYMADAADHEELLTGTLQVRDGKAKHAAEGTLRADLAKVPAKAIGVIAGNVPTARLRFPFPVPVTIHGHVLPVPKAHEAHFVAGMATDDEAKQLVAQISEFHKQALEAVKALRAAPANDALARQRDALSALVNSFQFEADGNKVQIRVLLPDGIIGATSLWLGARAAPGN